MALIDPIFNHRMQGGMKRRAVVVFLFLFMHSYFGVGSIKNALGAMPMPLSMRLLAAAFGLAWIGLAVGCVLFLLHRKEAMVIARGAALIGALLQLCEIVLFWNGGAVTTMDAVFIGSRAIPGIYLFLLLPGISDAQPIGKSSFVMLTLTGALLPWLCLFVLSYAFADMPPIPTTGPFIAFFVSLWAALPFVVLAVARSSWNAAYENKRAFIGGLLGTVIATVYAYSLIWAQSGNTFLLALLPPVVYAGQAVGIAAGFWVGRPRGSNTAAD